MSLNAEDFIVLPRTASLEDTQSAISYDTGNADQAALISYTYQDVPIGSVRVSFSARQQTGGLFDGAGVDETESNPEKPVFFIDVTYLPIAPSILAGVILITILVRTVIKNYTFASRPARNPRRRSGRREWKKRNRMRRH